jgi:hypothetical protein
MKASEFCYWLQGYFEISNAEATPGKGLTHEQVEMIERHLALVFIHDIDPKAGDAKQQAVLQNIHDGNRPQIGGIGPNGQTYRC